MNRIELKANKRAQRAHAESSLLLYLWLVVCLVASSGIACTLAYALANN
jgi:hypothetical protein